ncbi:uncharacterized protein LOC121936088 [Sceloporus undulatus]|uniref:uncharacterized protein LOC121936088 n=1 Tax=Sceloporus undulatus TaxID=8520 RepID=UPI001C4C8991|nr:uncharacterized protein LOC121936088 [Sceloporus undulatus]
MACIAHDGGMQKDKGHSFESWNFPECHCTLQKCAETNTGERSSLSSSSEMTSPEPQDSDFLPSLFLAAALAILFIFVSILLLHHDNSHIPLGDYRAWSLRKTYRLENSLKPLHFFFPNHPETTWQALHHCTQDQLGRIQHNRVGILVATEPRNGSITLLCLVKMTLSFLTKECAMKVQLLDQGSGWYPWRDFLESWTCHVSTAEIYMGQSLLPYGLMAPWGHSFDRKEFNLILSLNGTGQAQEEFLLLTSAPVLVSDILDAIHFANGGPEKLTLATNKSFVVLLVRPRQNLEQGFVS